MNDRSAEALEMLAEYTRALGNAIIPGGAIPGRDATDSYVSSLTEAVMGLTSAMMSIARAIDGVAEAIELGKDRN